MKQSDLAQKIGVAVITIGQYERGKREPSLETLQSIADALDVPVKSFFSDEDLDDLKRYTFQTVQTVGLPKGSAEKDVSMAMVREVFTYVRMVYGEKSSQLLRVTSLMNEAGEDKVLKYAESILPQYIDDVLPSALRKRIIETPPEAPDGPPEAK